MNKVICLLFLTAFVTSSLSFTTEEEWYKYESTKFNYSISFPGKPTKSVMKIRSVLGKIKLNMMIYNPGYADDNLLYMVNYTAYPAGFVNDGSEEFLDGFYEGAMNGAISKVDGEVISKKKIKQHGYEGRDVKFKIKDGGNISKIRMFLIKNRMYMLQTMSEASEDGYETQKRFFDSFDFTP
ncbi:MAG: hypothetical protein ACI8ZN_002586 [Bacteroidia bacterium]|jgi:hypothetical protein